MHQSNSEFLDAFPAALRDDALFVLSAFPENPHPSTTISVQVAAQVVRLPYRIYHDPAKIDTTRLTTLQKGLANCLLTRHWDGFVRQHYLTQIISSQDLWVPPFVLQLVGEYVVEILQVVEDNSRNLETPTYRRFLKTNPEFFALTEQRIISYWDCYYRHFRKDEYVGFKLLDRLKSLASAQD